MFRDAKIKLKKNCWYDDMKRDAKHPSHQTSCVSYEETPFFVKQGVVLLRRDEQHGKETAPNNFEIYTAASAAVSIAPARSCTIADVTVVTTSVVTSQTVDWV